MKTYIILEKNRARGGTLWILIREMSGRSVEISVHSSREGAELAKARLERQDRESGE